MTWNNYHSDRWNDRWKGSQDGCMVWGQDCGHFSGRWKQPKFHSVSCGFWWVCETFIVYLKSNEGDKRFEWSQKTFDKGDEL